jgi:hypothetical protein
MSEMSVSRIAYILALIGGILLVIFGLISLIGSSFGPSFLYWGWGFASFAFGGIISIICGVIAIIGAKSASTLVWAIVLIIVGIIGGGLGGILVVLGGLLGIIVVITKKA